MDRLRIGAVSYLNTKPLVYHLDQLAPHVDVQYDVPSRLADELRRGELDVALIPSIEYFQSPDYTIVSDACIGCRGPVLSVKLLSRVPIHEIKTLALDEGSRTSVALVRILLHQRYGLTPALDSFPMGAKIEEMSTDAVLVIGDRAIHPWASEFVEQWDLGDQWCRWAELPFVFAMWVAHRDTDLDGLEVLLGQARDAGVASLNEIASREAESVCLGKQQCLSYLRDNLHFSFGAQERQGLELFYSEAAKLDLAPPGVKLAPVGPGRIGYVVSG